MKLARLAALAGLALALQAPAAGAQGIYNDGQDDAFVVAGFGVCYYPAIKPADYFGVNLRCPRDPMPPDNHPWVDNGSQNSAGYTVGLGICYYGDEPSDSYFGVRVHCPITPMPGDTRNGG
jgi:hypothetical protein